MEQSQQPRRADFTADAVRPVVGAGGTSEEMEHVQSRSVI